MTPSSKWFPTNLQDRAAWYDNFNTQLQVVGAGLGLASGDLSSMVKDNANFQFLASTTTQLDAYAGAVRQYRVVFTEGNIGDPTPEFPADPSFTLPNPTQATG